MRLQCPYGHHFVPPIPGAMWTAPLDSISDQGKCGDRSYRSRPVGGIEVSFAMVILQLLFCSFMNVSDSHTVVFENFGHLCYMAASGVNALSNQASIVWTCADWNLALGLNFRGYANMLQHAARCKWAQCCMEPWLKTPAGMLCVESAGAQQAWHVMTVLA